MPLSDFDKLDEDEWTEDDFKDISNNNLIDMSLPSAGTDIEVDEEVEENNTFFPVKEFPEETEKILSDDSLGRTPSKYEMPTENALKRAIGTFEDIAAVHIELQAATDVITKEIKLLISSIKVFLQREKSDQVITLKDYENIYKKIESTIKTTDQYFDSKEEIPKEINNLKKELEKNFQIFIEEISKEKEEYVKNINISTERIEKSISTLTKDINLKPIIEKVNFEIGQVIHESSINKVQESLDKFNDVFIQLEVFSQALIGDNSKKGILQEFEVFLKSFDSKYTNIKKNFNYFIYLFIFIIGFLLSTICTYLFINSSFEEEKNTYIIKQTEYIHQFYKDKISNLESSNKAYSDFSRKYGLNKSNFGFDFFEDTNEPYFYYSKNAKSFLKDGKIYVNLKGTTNE